MTKSQWPDELQIPNVWDNGQYVRILFEEILKLKLSIECEEALELSVSKLLC